MAVGPLLFTSVVDALQWATEDRGVTWVGHYIDDFFTLGSPGAQECKNNVVTMRDLFEEAGLPTEPEKDEGPAMVIGLLGLEVDLEKHLPADKLARLKSDEKQEEGAFVPYWIA